MAFIASMISTNTLEENQMSAATLNEIKAVGGRSLSRSSSCLRNETASGGSRSATGSTLSNAESAAELFSIKGSHREVNTIRSPRNGTRAARA